MMGIDGVVCRHILGNSKYVMYNRWKAGMLYIRGVYGVQ